MSYINEKIINVCICVCTRDRPILLTKALTSIVNQVIPKNWNINIVVSDNSSETVNKISESFILNIINKIQKQTCLPIHLIHVQECGIPFARNAACKKSLKLNAEWIIFIDDDEEALSGWLNAYANALINCKSNVLTGPVEYIFPDNHDKWLKNKGFPLHKDGQFIKSAATNNVMFSTKLLTSDNPLSFDCTMALTGGSDADFFARYIHQGGKITAVSNARVKEHVSPHRVTLIWRLRRQMQSSANRVYTSRKLYPSKKVYISVLQEVLKRLIHGSIRTLTSPLWLIAGYYPFKKSLYHGLRHYAKAIGLTCALFNLKKHTELYRTTDGY